MVEIDNEIRTKIDTILYAGALEEQLQLLRTRISELSSQLKGSGARRGAPSPDNEQIRREIQTTIAAARAALAEVKRARKENANRSRTLLRRLDAERLARLREAQSGAGLYWGNRIAVRGYYDVARAQAMRTGGRLHTQPWDGTGTVTVYFSRGLGTAEVFGGNGRLQIDPVPQEAWTASARAMRRRLTRTRVRMRVSANADNSPVWLEFPMVMHRPLPERGIIRWASIVREKVGLYWRYRLLLTVREPLPPDKRRSDRAVGIDAGWRVVPDGLRVAYWCGSDGSHGALVLPQRDLAAFKQLDSLQAAITGAHADAQSALRSYIEKHPVPDQWKTLASAAASAASPSALAAFFEAWKVNRFDGDNRAFEPLHAWYKRYIHLWTWQANLRDQLIRRRRELYRCFAADLAKRFDCVFLKDIALRWISARSLGVHSRIPAQRHHRFIASLSVFFRIVQHTCEKHGATVMRVKAQKATLCCHACGALDSWDPATELKHTCSACGLTWDQDYNAARRILAEGTTLLLQKRFTSTDAESACRTASLACENTDHTHARTARKRKNPRAI
ncbi:MAG: transposase [Bryobacterales bacterium]|nr:transposase [Bryobacterales bacterium]